MKKFLKNLLEAFAKGMVKPFQDWTHARIERQTWRLRQLFKSLNSNTQLSDSHSKMAPKFGIDAFTFQNEK